MNCCQAHVESGGRIFSFFARRYRRRFERKGFEPLQQRLISEIMKTGLSGRSILEVGSGVGQLHQTLLEKGASTAVGIDLAPAMISEAEARASAHNLAERTQYRQGDFVELAEDIEAADIVLLDKVVCCYPDAEALIRCAAAKTTERCAVIYPRDHAFNRLGAALGAFVLTLLGSGFRPYVHPVRSVQALFADSGFRLQFTSVTSLWLLQVFERNPPS
jgi:2-polyprenyl-3-methyl-5-hydroxy-6-metoxy-1,4-benzoquinol methylase